MKTNYIQPPIHFSLEVILEVAINSVSDLIMQRITENSDHGVFTHISES